MGKRVGESTDGREEIKGTDRREGKGAEDKSSIRKLSDLTYQRRMKFEIHRDPRIMFKILNIICTDFADYAKIIPTLFLLISIHTLKNLTKTEELSNLIITVFSSAQ